MGRSRRKEVDLLENAYQLDGTDYEWLEKLTETASQCLEPGLGLAGYLFDYNKHPPFDRDSFRFINFPPELVRAQLDNLYSGSEKTAALLLGSTVCSTLSETVERAKNLDDATRDWFHSRVSPGDALGVVASSPDRTGAVLGVALPTVQRLGKPFVRRWERIAAHMAAGLRLRRIADRIDDPHAEDSNIEAVISPEGQVAHATGPAKPKPRREALQAAVKAIDRARGSLRQRNPDEALDLWRGLSEGRWTLVEHFEADGRRYYVAQRNDPDVPIVSKLTRREQQVLGYAALGHHDQLIGYELGLARATVSGYLSMARKKLGGLSRGEAITLFRELSNQASSQDQS